MSAPDSFERDGGKRGGYMRGTARRLTKKLVLLLVIAAACIATYLGVSSPGRLVVMNNGRIDGVLNVVRSKLQAEKFWHEQLRLAERTLEWEESAPERRTIQNERLAELEKRADQRREQLYQRNILSRPSPAEQRAEELRREADKVEEEDFEVQLEQHRLKRILRLQQVIELIKRKLSSPQGSLD